MMTCALCDTVPVPAYYGSPRVCAFDDAGIFKSENWNCETAVELRVLAHENGFEDARSNESLYLRRDDQSYAALYVPPHPADAPDGEQYGPWRGGGFIAMSWYKNHGRTDIMIRVDPRNGGLIGEAGLPLILREAEAALENFRSRKRV
jgi:hypothetical protein